MGETFPSMSSVRSILSSTVTTPTRRPAISMARVAAAELDTPPDKVTTPSRTSTSTLLRESISEKIALMRLSMAASSGASLAVWTICAAGCSAGACACDWIAGTAAIRHRPTSKWINLLVIKSMAPFPLSRLIQRHERRRCSACVRGVPSGQLVFDIRNRR